MIVTWPKKDSEKKGLKAIHIEEMRTYSMSKTKSVRSARSFLRSVGLNISSKGNIITGKSI